MHWPSMMECLVNVTVLRYFQPLLFKISVRGYQDKFGWSYLSCCMEGLIE